ncbi:MAG TPA: peroxiredoxin-like family protein [Rhodanobacteraceae bacterium]|nr:peroxiredoxin-like family protein [Rhodanobacteraceae bacterium]
MNSKIVVGQTFPDFELPDHTKITRRLSDLQGEQDPMLVVLIRGFFCPKDREQLKELTRFHPQLVVGSCHLVVITTDDWHTTNNLRQQLGAGYPFLYDEGKRVRDELEILEYTDKQHEPMIPHTFLLGPGLKIHKFWNGYYYWGRPSVAELHEALRELTRNIRADWDLYSGDLKRKWDAGNKSSFYPYGVKSMEQTLSEMAGAVDQHTKTA